MKQDRPVVDPRVGTRLSRFFPSLCTLQLRVDVQNAVGEYIPTWADQETDIPCRFASGAVVQPRASSEGITTIQATHRAILLGDFHDIRPDLWRAVIDGVAYNIQSVDWGEATFTMLEMNMQSPEPVNA